MGEIQKDHVKEEYPHSAITSKIIAASKEVHRVLGPGYQEVIYQRALALELPAYGLEFEREVWMDVVYKGEKIGKKRVDFLIEDVMVEISGLQVGLLLNFGAKSLGIKRLIHTHNR